MRRLLKAGTLSLKDIARKISSETGVEYRKAYKACLAMKREKQMSWFFWIDGAGRETQNLKRTGFACAGGGEDRGPCRPVQVGPVSQERRSGSDGASILSILALACPKGTEIEVKTVGEDSEALMEAISVLFEQKFGEGK